VRVTVCRTHVRPDDFAGSIDIGGRGVGTARKINRSEAAGVWRSPRDTLGLQLALGSDDGCEGKRYREYHCSCYQERMRVESLHCNSPFGRSSCRSRAVE
jgi:hypothetical protein